jgi:signal transduction histidine kinase
VDQQKYLFFTLWSTAIPAEQRIKEIEEGVPIRETKVLDNRHDIYKRIIELYETSSEIMVASTLGGLQMVHDKFLSSVQDVEKKRSEGKHKGIRWVVNITKDAIPIVKRFLELGIVQIRHNRNAPPLYYAVSDKILNATIEKMEGGRMVHTLLTSTEPLYVMHFKSVFEELWRNGTEAAEIVNDLEQGIEPDFVDVVTNRDRAGELLLKTSKMVKKQALVLLPNDKAIAQLHHLGVLDSLASASNHGADVRIICPISDTNRRIIEHYTMTSKIKFVHGDNIQSGIIVADRAVFQSYELTDPEVTSYVDSIGTTLYSNSRRTIDMLISFFDSLWNQGEVLHKLASQEKLEKEFINIAAHELRTPVQPLLAIAEFLLADESRELRGGDLIPVSRADIEMIARNAKRLERLTSDVLEVSRFESNTLKLNQELFDINEKIKNVIHDEKLSLNGKDVNLIFDQKQQSPLLVRGDKVRIFAVISNLVDNAIKFTESGTISVAAKRNDGEVTITVRDNGQGIDPEILPRLFGKFVTKSQHGTGLGLYLSRAIVNAHGGRIWAENNPDGKGATFEFTLPAATGTTSAF